MTTGFKKCCMPVEVGLREDEEGVGCWRCEHESVSSECGTENGNCEGIEAQTYDRNGEQSATGEEK
jgi:hypothetical protein